MTSLIFIIQYTDDFSVVYYPQSVRKKCVRVFSDMCCEYYRLALRGLEPFFPKNLLNVEI